MRASAYAITCISFFLLFSSAYSQDPIPGACGLLGPNLLANPEFDDGNTAFASDYNFFPDKICNFGDYTVSSGVFYDPADNCFGDATFNLQSIWTAEDRNDPGVGNFLMVDPSAANGTSDRIWEQSVSVCPNTDYVFSIFAKNLFFLEADGYSGIDPNFNFTINGVQIGDLFKDGVATGGASVDLPRQSQADAGVWIQISGRWNSGSATSALITMNNLVGVEQGNDLAVDGAYFGLCGKSVAVELLAGNATQCQDEGTVGPITLAATAETNASNWLYYQWLKDGQVVEADVANPISPYSPAPNQDGTYFANYELKVYTDPLGNSCAAKSETFSFQENCLTIFPVEWLDFQAIEENGKVELNWLTATELNNAGFEIEVSADAQLFKKVGWVRGFGNSAEVKSYSFSVNDLNPGKNYFRLKQIDFDGAFEYSKVIEASLSQGLAYNLNIYPNPARSLVNFELELGKDVEEILLDIYNNTGQKVKDYYQGPLNGNQSFRFPLETSSLTPGIYFLKIQHKEFVGIKTFVVQN
ncbi:MAG: T9SS type A sorting domain-containing protein [Bacteroidota bacterium]